MTLFRTTCPRCGEVEVSAEEIVFSLLDGAGTEQLGGYGFLCPECREGVWKGGRDRSGVFRLLLEADVEPIQGAAERILGDASRPRPWGRRDRRRLH